VASIFPDNVNVPWKPSFSLSDRQPSRTDILLQNEPDWITKPSVVFHHKRTSCADRGMPREVELRPR